MYHEVTDDWNMTRDFCRKVYSHPLGQRIVQNGLTAYAFCQHWGNVPEDFVPATPATPGSTLYALLDTPNPTGPGAFKQKATDYNNRSAQIRGLIGLHDAAALDARTDNAVFHEPFALNYHYSIVSPGHQIIVTDTRTWRAHPNPRESGGATNLLTKNTQVDMFKQQNINTPNPDDRQLLVVLTTNAPPIQPIRSATRQSGLANIFEHFPDLFEAWDLPSVTFDRLLTAVTSKLPVDASGKHTGSVILLSGDVHFAFASRVIYRATNRFEDTAPVRADAVVAQLVASSLKKQDKDTLVVHPDGYFASTHPTLTGIFKLIRERRTEGYVGRNLPKHSNTRVGVRTFAAIGAVEVLKLDVLTTIDATPVPVIDLRLSRQPDYRYRLDYLLPTAQTIEFPRPSIPPLPSGASTPKQRRRGGTTASTPRRTGSRPSGRVRRRRRARPGVRTVPPHPRDCRPGTGRRPTAATPRRRRSRR
ncbi:hypothetical protein [Actinophytocola sp.]|uniref:hypothetical protein n=1 Tax=Actinophytocola sp. TaxID=1872138 RepID=UPI003899D9C0